MKLVLFDFDGVIADSASLQVEVINDLSERFNYRKLKDVNEFRRYSMRELIQVLEVPRENIEMVVLTIKDEAGKRYSEVRLFKGMEHILQKLSKKCELAILSSNKEDVIESFLLKHKLVGIFSKIYCSKGLFEKHTMIDKMILERGIPKDEIAMVGDEARDVEAAHKSGIKAIAVLWGWDSLEKLEELKPDLICAKKEELLDIVKL